MTNNTYSRLGAAILLLFSLTCASFAQAQRMARVANAPSGSSRPGHAQPVGSHVVPVRSAANRNTPAFHNGGPRFNAASNTFMPGDGSVLSSQDLLNTLAAPGFESPLLGTTNRDLGIEAVIDPATQWRLAVAERLLRATPRFSGSGFYLLDGGASYAVPVESTDMQQPTQPQIIVVQAAPSAQPASQQIVAPETSQTAAPPLPDVGQFTLVLQNGSQIQAVAFSRVNDRIVYITADGSRRTLAVSDLNSEATVQVNQERGTPLQLPL